MSSLNYEKRIDDTEIDSYEEVFLREKEYSVLSLYNHTRLKESFVTIRANVVDLNPAMITKAVQGTEQDFIALMNKAAEFANMHYGKDSPENPILLDMFQECVFGYYVLTPLIKAADISDIHIYDWNKITCKSNGKRYVTNVSFYSEDDYERWIERMMRIQRLSRDEDDCLQFCTDIKGVKEYYLRIDLQTKKIVCSQKYNMHIRKIPTEKYSWDYFKNANMLDDDIIWYLKDRVASGYSFILSGKSGSGKTAVLNNLIDIIPFSESILVSQESDELYSDIQPHIQFEHVLKLEKVNGEKVVYTIEDILELGLLQDIDVIVVGEVKGGEALYVFTTAANTGSQFMLTLHSNDARSSVRRLAQCARFISNYTLETLERMLSSVPVVLIHFSSFSIDEILEVTGWDENTERLNFHEVYVK